MALLAIWPSYWLRTSASILIMLYFLQNIIRLSAQSSGDEVALISFKSLITNDPDGALSSWGNSSLHFCNWGGVTCSNHSGNEHRVTALELTGIDLAGSLSPCLGNLTFLQKLHISKTQLYGSIPHELGSLSNLQNLNLSYNSLSGEIPSNLSLCSKLQFIDFQANNLTGIIPPSLGALRDLKMLLLWNNKLETRQKGDWDFLTALRNCTSLQYLHLGRNNLIGLLPNTVTNLSVHLKVLSLDTNQIYGGIPLGIVKLVNLQKLYLSYNLLSGTIPPLIGEFPMLETLSLENNQFSGAIPPSICNLSSLSELYIGENNLTGGIPPCLGKLSSLNSLYLNRNNLTGEIPSSLGHLFYLKFLSLDSNQIYGGIPFGIVKLVNLQKLYLSYNLLSATIPPLIGELSMLKLLSLEKNQFSGTIPPSICNLSSLSELYIGKNNLTGGIPPCLGNLTSLNSLYLNQNNLIGEIPSSLGHLFNLEGISLDTNNLYGNIPPSLGNLQFLVMLYLSDNKLSGFIPDSLWNLTSLRILNLRVNNLTGALPMKTLPFLEFLYLDNNNLQGPIPSSVFNSSALEILQLYKNFFNGTIHTNIGNLKNLHRILLGHNNLQARDNKEWSFILALTNCTKLDTLDLNTNNLEGILPHSIGNLTTTLNILTLGGNKISGNIPIEIENLIGLTWLSLGPNNLTGTIPEGIEKLKSLQLLMLYSNRLAGEIPYSLGNLSLLNGIYLYENNFSGYIPSSLGRCKQLTTFELQNNMLTGPIPREILSITSLSIAFDLSNNLLVGPLPIDVGLLVNLVFLSVSNNKLMGQIPSSLSSCVELEYLYMENNLFQGNIPSSLKALKSLVWFNLSYNNLSGKIPEILQPLQYLDLSYNHLEGEVPKSGIFLNKSAFSVDGNDKLCGGIAELKLPPCPVSLSISRKKHNATMVLATIIPITCIIILFIILLLAFLTWRSKKSKKLSLLERLERDQNHLKVSYAELQRATNGFSSHNLIGMGSFGSVYLGNMNHNWQKVIVVKVLNLQQRGASKSFEAECKALRNVRHRNLVKILTSCLSIDHKGNDFKALVFEYMPNGNLDKWLYQQSMLDNYNGGKLTIIQRMNIIIDVACALDYLHNHGPTPIVHCDLKPSNILLDEDMVAHVSDFGLARLLIESTTQSSQTSTSSVALKGTVGYVAPEYGVANQVSVEGDLYSYGIILLEMFTGRIPTEEIFSEGLSLHVFVRAALPEKAMDIVDPSLLLQEEDDKDGEAHIRRTISISRLELECIVSVLKVGLLCSEESPTKRMQISQALNELYAIRNIYLKSSNNNTHL